MATDTALVTQLTGQAWMRTADGTLIPLTQGMRVPVEAEIVTADGASVQLQIDGVPPLLIGASREMQLGEDVVQAQPEPAQSAVALPEDLQMRALVTALNNGQDPFADLEATAAVNSGGGEGGGSFSRLLNVIELTSPLDLAYPRPTPVPTEDVILSGATGQTGDDPLAAGGDAGSQAGSGGQALPGIPAEPGAPTAPVNPDPAAPANPDPADPAPPVVPPAPPVPVPPVPPVPTGPDNTPPQAAAVNLAFANEDADDLTATGGLDMGQHFSDPDGDRLTYTATGLPKGLSIDPDTGIITGKVDNSASQDGNNGVHTVVVRATDPSGDSATITFDWTVTNPGPDALKDEGTTSENVLLEVKPEDGLLKNDTDKDGDDLIVTGILDGSGTLVPAGTPFTLPNQGTLTVQPDGSYTFNPGSDFDYLAVGEETKVTYTYQISDGEGGIDTAELVITITGTNDAPVVSANGTDAAASVTEIADNAVGENSTTHSKTGTITFTDADTSDSAHTATVVPKGNGFLGDLTLGAVDQATGTVQWTFKVADSAIDYLNAGETLTQEYEVTVDDGKGGTATQAVTITIVGTNDAPTIESDASQHVGTVHENAAGAGESGTATGTLAHKDVDTSHTIKWDLVQDPANPGSSALTPTIQGQYGTITLNVTTGKWEYTLDDTNPAVNALGDNDALSESFTARVTDDQGAYSQQAITITIRGKADGIPGIVAEDGNGASVAGHITVSEKGLAGGSDSTADATKNGSITITAGDGLSSVKIGGQEFTLSQLEGLANNPSGVIRVGPGEIVLTGFTPTASVGGVPTAGSLEYTYTLVDAKTHKDAGGNPLESLTTDVVLEVKDAKGVTKTGTLTVNVVDDAPEAKDDRHAVTEGTASAAAGAIQGNILTGSANAGDAQDVQGADTAKVTQVIGAETRAVGDADVTVKGLYGTLTIKADGSYSYQLEDDNAAVNALKGAEGGTPAQTLDEVFTYTLTDADGDADTATLTITITGATDGPPTIGAVDENGNGAVNGHITVSEKGLTGGSGSAQDAQATGTIKVTSPEGLASIVLVDKDGKDVVLSLDDLKGLGSTSREIDVGHGKIVLTGFTPSTTVAGKAVVSGDLTYTYTLGETQTHDSADAHDEVSVGLKVVDAAGSEASGRLIIDVRDDAPVAQNDAREVKAGTWVLDGQAGNVTTNDAKGADGAKVTQVVGAETKPVGDTDVTVRGEYGTLTIKSDGSYSYVRDAGTKGGVSDVFTYTLKDGDGDTDTATLTINIADAAVSVVSNTASLNESALSSGDVIQNGSVTFKAPDGVQGLTVVFGGTEYKVVDGAAQTLPTISTPLGTLTITGYSLGNDGNGKIDYTYTLSKAAAHSDGDGTKLTDSFTIKVTDKDGDTSSGTLNVTVVDDKPVVTADGGKLNNIVVDETGLAQGVPVSGSASFADVFKPVFGADGAAASDSIVYSLEVGAGVSGLVDTASDKAIVLVKQADGSIVGHVQGDANAIAFTVSIDTATKEVTLTQALALKHAQAGNAASGKHDDIVKLNADAIVLKATVTDADGDQATSQLSIGQNLQFKDDGPSITLNEADAGKLALLTLQTQDADTINGPDTATANFKDVFSATGNYGADGSGSTTWGYKLGLSAGSDSGLKHGGVPITLSVSNNGNNNTITGKANDEDIFTIKVSSNGKVTLTQIKAIDHPDKAQAGEEISMALGKITLTATATIKDKDGDTDSSAKTISIGDKFIFTDHGPKVTAPASQTVNEKDLAWGSAADGSGKNHAVLENISLGVDFGGDHTAGADTYFTQDALTAWWTTLGGLQSGGKDVSVSLHDRHTLQGVASDGTPVFEIKINNPGTSAANYTFTLQAALDHPLVNGAIADSISLTGIPFTVKDADGDTVSGAFTVVVADDAQAATKEGDLQEDQSWSFFTSADGAGGNVAVTQGAYGAVTVDADTGKVTYVPKENFSGTDTFTYTVTEGGETKTTTVTVTVSPIADAPTFAFQPGKTEDVSVDEDHKVALGLDLPVITDAHDWTAAQSGDDLDNPERLGLIELTGLPAGSRLYYGSGADDYIVIGQDGKATIALATQDSVTGEKQVSAVHTSEAAAAAGAPAVLLLTENAFKGLQVLPPADSGDNFVVTASVTSYEVDKDGAQRPGVSGATTTVDVDVDVKAVTDPFALTIRDEQDVLGKTRTVSINEDAGLAGSADAAFDLAALLNVNYDPAAAPGKDAFNSSRDADGSETYWFVVSGLPAGANVVAHGVSTQLPDGTPLPAGSFYVPAQGLAGAVPSMPDIKITPPKDFSGEIKDIKVTLYAQDTDSDSPDHTPAVLKDEITLNLVVNPVAGDVTYAEKLVTNEDTAITHFLDGIRVTDGSSNTGDGGSEVITALAISGIPADWVIRDAGDQVVFTGDGTAFTVPQEAIDSGAWRGYSITPPPHSSLDAKIQVSVTTVDSSMINGKQVDNEVTRDLGIDIEVKPIAERFTDSDGKDGLDVATITGTHATDSALGKEDQWFALKLYDSKADGGFGLDRDAWSNSDADEEFYALLKPVLSVQHAGDTAAGAQFKYTDDQGVEHTVVFDGTRPVQVPVEFLDTLQFLAPKDVAGEFKIEVGVRTVDYDQDDTSKSGDFSEWRDEKVATLEGIKVAPQADGIESLAVGGVKGRAEGLEDSLIALSIRPSSLDKSEVFTVEISKIPVGAVLYYGVDADGKPVPVALESVTDAEGNVVGQKITIENFDQTAPLHILPPSDSNADFSLDVRSKTVDSLPDGSRHESDWLSKPLPVRVKGDADGVTGGRIVDGKYDLSDVAQKDVKLTEDSLTKTPGQPAAQNDTNRILLSSLIVAAALTLKDADGSEALSLKLTGLHKDFTLKGDHVVFLGGEGEERAWLLQIADASEASIQDLLDKTAIQVPQHFSGKVEAKLVVVTTEDDGDYLSGEVALSAEVTPQADGTVSGKSVIVEDQKTKVVFALNNHGDADETLTAVYIKKEDVATQQQFDSGSKPFILFLGDKALSDADVNTETKDGVEYYVLRGDDIDNVSAQAKPQFAHNQSQAPELAFDVRYEITDHPSHDGVGQPAPVVTLLPEEKHALEVTAQTDQAQATLTDVAIDAAIGAFSDAGSVLALKGSGIFGVKVQLTSPDADGSEQVVRLQIDGVPDGLTVAGLTIGGVAVDNVAFLGGSAWLVTVPKDVAVFSDAAGVEATVQFHAGEFLSSRQSDTSITIKALTQDTGAAVVSSNAVALTLSADSVGGGSGGVGPDRVQVNLQDKDFQGGVEDKPFLLSDALSATVAHGDNARVTLMLTLPESAQVARLEGGNAVSLSSTTIAGKEVWFISGPASDLDALLDHIQITPPANLNTNTGTADWLSVTVTAYDTVNGGQAIYDITPDVSLAPVTDAAQIDIAFSAVDGDGQPLGRQPQEGDSVGIKVSVANAVDGDTTLGENLYLKLAEGVLDGGSLWYNGVELTAVTLTAGGDPADNPLGLEPGNYYVVPLGAVTLTDGSPSHALDLVYKPAPGKEFTSGTLAVQAWVQNQESGSVVKAVASNVHDGQIADKDKVDLEAVNNGFKFDVGTQVGGKWVVKGDENPGGEGEGRIKLGITAPGLVDTDGSEVARIALLKSLPKDFLVYFGADEGSAKLANNVGSNEAPEWTIPMTGNQLPAYIAVVPPRNWSGKIDGIELSVLSGETTLTPQPNDPRVFFDLQVTAVADGVLSLNPAAAFGPEGEIITLNLNLVMADGSKVGSSDASTETTSLTLKGLGNHAVFYVDPASGGAKVPVDGVIYDMATDTYTLRGLTQAQVDSLSFVPSSAAPAIGKVEIHAWTVESDGTRSEGAQDLTGTFDLAIRKQGTASGGNDTLLFDGFNPLDGGAGDDTVWLRFDQDLDFNAQAGLLKNVETIDLTRDGFDHRLSNLDAEHVFDITGGGNVLTIEANAGDGIGLADGVWTLEGQVGGYDRYTATLKDEQGADRLDDNGDPIVVELHVTSGFEVDGVLDTLTADGSVGPLLAGLSAAPLALPAAADAGNPADADAGKQADAPASSHLDDGAAEESSGKGGKPGEEGTGSKPADADKPQAAPVAPLAGPVDADASGQQNQMINDMIQQGRLSPDL